MADWVGGIPVAHTMGRVAPTVVKVTDSAVAERIDIVDMIVPVIDCPTVVAMTDGTGLAVDSVLAIALVYFDPTRSGRKATPTPRDTKRR